MKVIDWINENFDPEEGEKVWLATGYDDALIGVASHCGRGNIAIYDYARCIEILVKQGMDEEEADEYFNFNVIGGFVGHDMPLFVVRPPEGEYEYGIEFDPKDLVDQVELDELEKEKDKCQKTKD